MFLEYCCASVHPTKSKAYTQTNSLSSCYIHPKPRSKGLDRTIPSALAAAARRSSDLQKKIKGNQTPLYSYKYLNTLKPKLRYWNTKGHGKHCDHQTSSLRLPMASHVNVVQHVAIASHFDDGEVHGIPREEGIQVQASQLGNINIQHFVTCPKRTVWHFVIINLYFFPRGIYPQKNISIPHLLFPSHLTCRDERMDFGFGCHRAHLALLGHIYQEPVRGDQGTIGRGITLVGLQLSSVARDGDKDSFVQGSFL